ncbi:hypothetical protein PISMIDRAFT_681059 [Pisolithus microcarpus 441]|uniref:Uncharacterized protein n=1 Tax=Pisolithus microcarpus 441 TaxID=765257 RepID=A0A0C9YAJ5_9AGAM|nr:hypothetical protein PISMIDRAFT_681059 [Pisolithus microcarpus 441]
MRIETPEPGLKSLCITCVPNDRGFDIFLRHETFRDSLSPVSLKYTGADLCAGAILCPLETGAIWPSLVS